MCMCVCVCVCVCVFGGLSSIWVEGLCVVVWRGAGGSGFFLFFLLYLASMLFHVYTYIHLFCVCMSHVYVVQ